MHLHVIKTHEMHKIFPVISLQQLLVFSSTIHVQNDTLGPDGVGDDSCFGIHQKNDIRLSCLRMFRKSTQICHIVTIARVGGLLRAGRW